ncbi:MAG: FliI/YscN family ATPase [Candidatus Kapabacteria bacterium]|nr:FliI/YscN family ATPase [Candidatus Kapabacteria bacterium]MDW7997543.1 FliI/YscN family ATPase [Bacteroidota bacterium]MDW8225287.1 FliI/YscN family ATPase [Bacteroidota bacterium]
MLTAHDILTQWQTRIRATRPVRLRGRIRQVVGLLLESTGPYVPIGELCSLRDSDGRELCKAEVVGFRDTTMLSMVLGEPAAIAPGMEIVASGRPLTVRVGSSLLGRVLDGLGQPLDGKPLPPGLEERPVHATPPNPLLRQRVTQPIGTGIRAIDAFLTLGKGQRVGIFSGSGVGKSILLGMIARNTSADVNVIALIGERGREVRDFIEKDLQTEGLRRSVLVVATSDMPPLVRVKASLVATTIAEYFRDHGFDVFYMMDSATRLAMAQREIGIAIGEPPTTKGYTPSVFSLLHRVMERAGTGVNGTITGLYTVLVEGDDLSEPIADAVRGILDGHIVLSRRLAAQAHYPAIDILESVSRVMPDIVSAAHLQAAQSLKALLATYRESEDLINVGAYQPGTNPRLDRAIALRDALTTFLRQGIHESSLFEDTIASLLQVAREAEPT